jgi:hypothetical protein
MRCLRRVFVDKLLSNAFPFHSGLKQRGLISPLLLKNAQKYAVKKVPMNQEWLE